MLKRHNSKPEEVTLTKEELLPTVAKPEIPIKKIANEINSVVATHKDAAKSTSKNEGRVLIGEGVSINGEIRDCREIEIRGTVKGDLESEVVIVHASGHVEGNVSADRAEIHGSVNGEISVKYCLDVKAKGFVSGTTKYGELSVEAGGRVVGTLEEQTDKFEQLRSTSETKGKSTIIPQPSATHQPEYAV